MGRRSGFAGFINALARDAARARRQAEVAQRRQQQEMARAIRESERATARAARSRTQAEKEARQQHIADQIELAAERTKESSDRVDELSNVLAHTLSSNDRIDFHDLRLSEDFPPLDLPKELRVCPTAPSESAFLEPVQAPSGFGKLVPGATRRYEAALQVARSDYAKAVEQHSKEESLRLQRVQELTAQHAEKTTAFLANVQRRNAEVDDFQKRYREKDPEAVVAYNNMVLERSDYPDGFPDDFSAAFVSESKELVVERELPLPTIVPMVEEFRYVKTRDEFDERALKPSRAREIYEDLIASIALRTIHEILEADHTGSVQLVTFNGFVRTVDPSTGRDIQPCLVSVRATRERFLEIDLRRINKKACLRNLGAQVSPQPLEVQPVKPIVAFDMVDKRFVDQPDVLGGLESRPNLMDLTPSEFEALVGNLFASMGLETRLTRSTKDGGVDVVAFDTRPVLGGKVVIQAKRYRHTVGVAAVRDLFGTMVNEGANKGILVTTSGYGPDAFSFAEDKPIELIPGSGLLYLLEQVGTKARIVMPEDSGT